MGTTWLREGSDFDREKLFTFGPCFDYQAVSRDPDGTKPTSCRLELLYSDALEGRAKELGISKSELVRKYLIAGLKEDASAVSLHEELPAIRAEITQLRRDIGLVAISVLIRAGRMSPAEAQAWAHRNLLVPNHGGEP